MNGSTKWTLETCIEEASKYKTLEEFTKNSSYCYKISKKHGWFDIVTKDLLRGCPGGCRESIWNKDKCLEQALKYEYRSDFKNYSESAYQYAWKNNWLDDICSHMKIKGSKYKRFIYAYEFPNRHVYVGLTFNIKSRKQKHKESGTVYKYIKETGIIPIFKILTDDPVDVEEAVSLEGEWLEKYIEDGWIPLNKTKTGNIGGNNLKWTFEVLKEVALKYKYKKEFYTNDRTAYAAALKTDFFDEICAHMEDYHAIYRGKYPIEKCKEWAKEFSTRGEFKKKYPYAYATILKKGWQDIVFEGFKVRKSRNFYTKEKCMELCQNYESKVEMTKDNATLATCLYDHGWMREAEKMFKNNN